MYTYVCAHDVRVTLCYKLFPVGFKITHNCVTFKINSAFSYQCQPACLARPVFYTVCVPFDIWSREEGRSAPFFLDTEKTIPQAYGGFREVVSPTVPVLKFLFDIFFKKKQKNKKTAHVKRFEHAWNVRAKRDKGSASPAV